MRFNQDSQFHRRLEELFHQAMELAPESRHAFLEQTCRGDEEVRIAVQKLLHAAGGAEATPAWNGTALDLEAAAATRARGAELDRYQLMERLGSGGMGVVYRATRAGDFSKVVAIKIVHEAGPAMVDRFLQERQILARLEHPNIARLLDGGASSDGLPFLVMEYVEGVTIDRHVEQKKLTQREILELFRKVCSAVSFAHANLIVHRDLKPGNVLVTADGEPKLLDFGVAKCLDSTKRTVTGIMAMTPAYASPEQIEGKIITTASDIYSLAVLLYELLTGSSPYRHTANTLELAREICAAEPESMSARSGKRFDPDLERILQMAMRKEPERRYASVEQFSEDLRRRLEGYPVMARPATRRYRVAKFVRRNRAPLAAAALTLFTLIGGIAATAWEARQANRRFNDVRKLANSYLFEFYEGVRDLPGSTGVRQLVVKRALEYLDSLTSERASDRALERELAAAYVRVGDVQGAPNRPSLGDRAGAAASYRKAAAILQRVWKAAPTTDSAMELAECYSRLGVLLGHTGDLKGAAESARQALNLMERAAGAPNAGVKARDTLAESYIALGDVTGNNDVPNLGNAAGALELFRKAVAIREQLAAEEPSVPERLMMLAVSYGRVAVVLQALNDKPGAAEAFRRAIAIDEQLVRQDPLKVVQRREIAVYSRSLSLLLQRMGERHEARRYGDRSAELFAQLAREDPQNREAQEALADSLWSQGILLSQSGDTAGASRAYNSAISTYQELLDAHPEQVPAGLRTAYQLVAELGLQTADTAKTLEFADKQLAIDQRLLAVNPANAGAQRNQGIAYMQKGKAHEARAAARNASPASRLTEWKTARDWYQRSLDVWTQKKSAGTLVPADVSRLDDARRAVEKCDAALKQARLAGRRTIS